MFFLGQSDLRHPAAIELCWKRQTAALTLRRLKAHVACLDCRAVGRQDVAATESPMPLFADVYSDNLNVVQSRKPGS